MPDVSTIIGLKKLRAVARLHQQARALLAEGRNAEALAFAAQNGFQLDDIPKLDVAVPKELPKPVEPSPVTAQLDAILGPELVNGWPVECEATVWNTCRNPNLVLILLDDGRDAAMWTGKRRWRMGSKLRVKLDDARADPKYVAIEGTIH